MKKGKEISRNVFCRRAIALISFFIFISTISFAQTAKKKNHVHTADLFGNVKDSFTGADLQPFVTLMKADSTVIDTVTSELPMGDYSKGGYYFSQEPVEVGKYIVKAVLNGYNDAYIDYHIKYIGRNVLFALPLIKMRKKIDAEVHELDEVKVKATLVKLVHKGDTLVYNAEAFKVPQGSMLDGLIRQLPGAVLKDDGEIFVNGRKIDNLTLNGDDFFKGDNSTMLKNLPYFTVNQIKVYDKQTEKSRKAGRDIEPREYTMDVVLKRQYNRGYITNAEGGLGTHSRYTGQTFLLGYGALSRLSVYGNLNNLNQNPEPGDQGNWTPQKMGDGLTTTKKTGLDFQTKDKDGKWNEYFSTQASWLETEVQSSSLTQQFVETGDLFSGSRQNSDSHDFKWETNNKFELGNNLTWKVNADYQRKRDDELQSDSTSTFEQKINSSSTFSGKSQHIYNVSTSFDYQKTLPWGDIVNFTFSGELGNTQSKQTETKAVHYWLTADHLNQLLTTDNPQHTYNFSMDAVYSIPFTSKWSVTPELTYQQEYLNSRASYMRDSVLDNNSFQSGLLKRSGEASFRLGYNRYDPVKGSVYFRYIMKMKRQNERYSLYTPLGAFLPGRSSWLPSIWTFFYAQNSKHYIFVQYQLTSSLPDLSMMYGSDNTLSPLVTIYRNRDLKKMSTESLNAKYYRDFAWHKFSWGVDVDWTTEHGKIGYQRSMDSQTGSYQYRPQNINGNWDFKLGMNEILNLDTLGHFSLESTSQYEHLHSVDFDVSTNGLTDRLSKVDNRIFFQQLKATYKKGNLQIGFNGVFNSTHASSRREGFEDFTYYDFQYGINLQTPLLWKLNFVTDCDIYSHRGYSVSSMNTNDLVWNASVSRSFIKNKLVVSLESYDLLHKLSNFHVDINAQARSEVRFKTIPNYFMLKLQYHFNLLPKK